MKIKKIKPQKNVQRLFNTLYVNFFNKKVFYVFCNIFENMYTKFHDDWLSGFLVKAKQTNIFYINTDNNASNHAQKYEKNSQDIVKMNRGQLGRNVFRNARDNHLSAPSPLFMHRAFTAREDEST